MFNRRQMLKGLATAVGAVAASPVANIATAKEKCRVPKQEEMGIVGEGDDLLLKFYVNGRNAENGTILIRPNCKRHNKIVRRVSVTRQLGSGVSCETGMYDEGVSIAKILDNVRKCYKSK